MEASGSPNDWRMRGDYRRPTAAVRGLWASSER